MPRSHKPRKRYVPKHVDLDTIGLAIGRATVLDAEQRVKLNISVLDALVAFRHGGGNRAHWMNLADAMNVAEAIAQAGIFGDDMPAAYAAAQQVLSDVSDRHEAGGSWTLRGPELTALDQAVQCHELQLDHVSQGELADAITLVKHRVAGALAGNAAPGTRICTAGTLGRPWPAAAEPPIDIRTRKAPHP